MTQTFQWDAKSIAVEGAIRNAVEEHMEKVLDYSGASHSGKIHPCHLGEPVLVHLYQYNPLKNEAHGEIKCCCGEEVKRFTMNVDTKEITYY